MSNDYLWDRTGPPDPDIVRLEETLGTLRYKPSADVPAWARAADEAVAADATSAPARSATATPATATSATTTTMAADAEPIPAQIPPQIAAPGPLPRQARPAISGVAGDRVVDVRARPTVGDSSAATWDAAARAAAMRPGELLSAPARSGTRYVLPFAIAATLLAGVGVGWLSVSSFVPRASWEVSRLDGVPTVAARDIGTDGRLPVGEWLETDATARARIKVAGIGRVDVEPDSRVGLLSARAGNYRLQLARGTMHALIWSPPGQFFVETPSSTAVDLGCAYTLTVDDDGAGTVEVTSGWVGFEWKGRESFIPSGAVCATRPGIGPGTPHYADVSSAFQAALTRLDFERVTPEAREAALAHVLAEARARDAVTLWHLLSRVEPADRDRVFDRLAEFVPPPAGVTREGIRAARRDMLDRWWDDLGLGTMSLWRGWKQGWRDRR